METCVIEPTILRAVIVPGLDSHVSKDPLLTGLHRAVFLHICYG